MDKEDIVGQLLSVELVESFNLARHQLETYLSFRVRDETGKVHRYVTSRHDHPDIDNLKPKSASNRMIEFPNIHNVYIAVSTNKNNG